MAWETIKVEVNKHVARIVMNRPEILNAMGQQMASEISACLRELAPNEDLRVLVLTGAGRGFCTGADLRERDKMTPKQTGHHRATVLQCVDLLENFPVPVIARVNGPAVAGGFETALACDIRVAAESSFFALTETLHVGSFPGGGGPVRLPRLAGKGIAKLVVFTGRRFSAIEAQKLGFVEVVVPDDRLDAEVDLMIKQIVGNSPLGVRAAKIVINEGAEMHVKAATILSQAFRNPLDYSKDYREGLTAWIQKREAHFTGE